MPDTYTQGSIQRVDLDTGAVETLYTESSSGPLIAPNDLVFDAHGGFWFTDHGIRRERTRRPHGHPLREGRRLVVRGGDLPARLAQRHRPVARRHHALRGRDPHRPGLGSGTSPGPGRRAAATRSAPAAGTLLAGLPGLQFLDSLAVDGDGWVCVGTLVNGGITAVSPDGATVEHTPLPDLLVTNICFGGEDLRTAYVTLSGTGKLAAIDWPRPGLKLAH